MKFLLGLVGVGLLGLAPLGAFAERDGVRTRDVRVVASNEGRLGGPLPTLKAIERKAKLAEKKAAEAMAAEAEDAAKAKVAAEAKALEKRLTQAKRWSDITDQLKGVLPTNVVKEFADFGKGESLPMVRREKGKLVFEQEDGTSLTIAYKADGVVSINGIDWKTLPLASVEEEVARLSLFLEGEVKAGNLMLEALFPTAKAAATAKMLAALGFATASNWKASACDEKKLSKELNQDCPLMAVKMLRLKAKEEWGENSFIPINLSCPKDPKNGTLDLFSRNAEGSAERMRVIVKDGKVISATLSGSENGEPWEDYFVANDWPKLKPEDKTTADKIVERAQVLQSSVCDGKSAEKKRYAQKLESNRSDTRKNVPSDEEGVGAGIDAT
jgi:hypothetical protein